MIPVHVEAYAGTNYPERPLRVRWGGRWRRIARVVEQRQEPERRCFAVVLEADPSAAEDDTRLRLCYHYANDVWQAEALSGGVEAP